MAGRENRQCPHFNIHNGVCGCPEFWIPAQRPQNGLHPSRLQDMTNTRSERDTAGYQFNSSVKYAPPVDHTKTKPQPVTRAPPGPPKETCFFWYHGSCRRGDDCDRPHEAHSTWPIPPPPGFRHFQPCMLPLCPLRADLGATKMPQEYQLRGRTIGGQMDGAAFSRTTTPGESSSDNVSSSNTNTDTSEAIEHMSIISHDHVAKVPARYDISSRTYACGAHGEGTDQEGQVKLHQKIGSHEPNESDYVDLSQLFSPPSTPLVQEGSSLSISHPGTLGKRRQSPSRYSRVNNKRVKLAKDTPPDLSNVISILERPRNMSLCDIKPSDSGTNHSHIGVDAAHLTLLHSPSPQPILMPVANNDFVLSVPQPFDPPKGPRSTSVLPLICFFFYHKGYCNPKRGRRCGYLHNMDTSQMTVSLPDGIDNHDPMCSLQLCPVRLQYCGRKRQELALPPTGRHPVVKHETMIPANMDGSPFPENMGSSPHDGMTAMHERYPNGMLGQPLPQLMGAARQQFKEQTRRTEQNHLGERFASTEFSYTLGFENRIQGKKKARRQRRRSKKQSHAKAVEPLRLQMEGMETIPRRLNSHSDTYVTQPSGSAFIAEEESPIPRMLPPVGDRDRTRREPEPCNKKPLHCQRAEQLCFENSSEDKDIQRSIGETVEEWIVQSFPSSPAAPTTPSQQDVARAVTQNDVNKALEILRTMNKDSSRGLQNRSSNTATAHEFSQASLGLTREERRAAIREEQHARRQAFHQRREQNEGKVACVGTACPETDSTSTDKDALGHNSAIKYRLPGDGPRLDWDTDLVRRLFGEVE